jgi:hypothetical protein
VRIDLAAARSKDYAHLMRIRRVCHMGVVVLGAACSSPQPSTTASGSVAPSTSASAAARTVETAAASSTPTARSSDAPVGLELDPAWLAEEPKLGQVLALAKPICVLQERIDRELSHPEKYQKTYSASAPTRPQEALEKDLRSEGKRLGVPLVEARPTAMLVGEATESTAFVMGSSVVVSARGKKSLRDDGARSPGGAASSRSSCSNPSVRTHDCASSTWNATPKAASPAAGR